MSDEMSEFVYDTLEPQSKIIRVGGKAKYILFEAGEGAAAKYKNAAGRSVRMNDGKVCGVEGVGEIPAILIAECLYELDESGKLRTLADGVTPDPKFLVPIKSIRFWPSRLTGPMFKWIVEASHLDEKPDNSPERKALLAALTEGRDAWMKLQPGDHIVGCGLEQFRVWIRGLKDQNEQLYGPLWKLVEPRDSDPNGSHSSTTGTSS